MNAQHLAALGTMVREAITEHCKALGEVFAQQLSERDQQIESLTSQLQQMQNTPTPHYDDTEIKQAVQALRESIPTPYDDAPIKHLVADVEKRVCAKQSQGTEALLGRISDVAKSAPAAYDDTALRQQIEGVAKSVPAAYDDTTLRADLSALIKQQDEQIQMVAKMAAERPTPADGRDALQLEVLPAIEEQKSYTRGTYAKHAGGLWRAFEQTSGMRGWECIVDGIASLTAEMQGKSLVVRAIQSSGKEAFLQATLPVQTYKGVFAHGEHEQGDTVTWAGSLWHCNVTGTKALPGDGSADWTLAVKKGRDGREVVKTERAQGPVHLTPLQFIDQLGR